MMLLAKLPAPPPLNPLDTLSSNRKLFVNDTHLSNILPHLISLPSLLCSSPQPPSSTTKNPIPVSSSLNHPKNLPHLYPLRNTHSAQVLSPLKYMNQTILINSLPTDDQAWTAITPPAVLLRERLLGGR